MDVIYASVKLGLCTCSQYPHPFSRLFRIYPYSYYDVKSMACVLLLNVPMPHPIVGIKSACTTMCVMCVADEAIPRDVRGAETPGPAHTPPSPRRYDQLATRQCSDQRIEGLGKCHILCGILNKTCR